ncbi:MAG: hypothetical protein L6408_03280 [Nanoarchaeota archaeon]|nr:hypothetical protein [Nanoarchaeota archaeon]
MKIPKTFRTEKDLDEKIEDLKKNRPNKKDTRKIEDYILDDPDFLARYNLPRFKHWKEMPETDRSELNYMELNRGIIHVNYDDLTLIELVEFLDEDVAGVNIKKVKEVKNDYEDLPGEGTIVLMRNGRFMLSIIDDVSGNFQEVYQGLGFKEIE